MCRGHGGGKTRPQIPKSVISGGPPSKNYTEECLEIGRRVGSPAGRKRGPLQTNEGLYCVITIMLFLSVIHPGKNGDLMYHDGPTIRVPDELMTCLAD